MLKRVAIVTLYNDINIGNKLQNYAVQSLCLNFAQYVTTLKYVGIKDIGWKGKIIATLGFPRKRAYVKRLKIERKKRFAKLSAKWFNVQHELNYNQFDQKTSARYDAIVVGSDQVWHNWTGTDAELDYFFLGFAEKSQRICLAPSFGFDSIPHGQEEKYKNGISGFNMLSCRENSGCKLIESLTGRRATLLIDPTLMLSQNDWDEIAKKPDYIVPNQYILVYTLGSISSSGKAYIKKLSNDYGWSIVDITDMSNVEYYLTTPDEFLYLVRNASYVVTNSFHGSVFSILYHKNFSVFPRADAGGAVMGDRINTLLGTFELENRYCFDGNPGNEIDYEQVDMILNGKRKEELEYLKKAFAAVEEL